MSMDIVDIGAAVALAKKTVLPAASSSDAGDVLTVGQDGAWTKGAVSGAVIAVSGTTLTITQEGDE